MSILLIFGEGAISSSESHVLSDLGVREPGVPETKLPLWTLCIGEGSLAVFCSGCCLPKLVRGSLGEAALEGGRGNGSTIWQSGGDDGNALCEWELPLSGVAS